MMERKFLSAFLFIFLLILLPLSGGMQAGPNDYRTLVLSNELGATTGGGLIDRLIAAGYGSHSLYQVLQLLAAQPGSTIPAAFVTEVGNNPAGSEVFTVALSNFAGLNNPVGINGDGTLRIVSLRGRDYEGDPGFTGTDAVLTGVVWFRCTMADNSSYYIDTGFATIANPNQNYMAIGIVWANAIRTFFLSNETPGFLMDKLVAAGYGNQNLYQVLQFLASQPGSGIPADFVAEVGNNPPGSEVFTAPLHLAADPSNNPIGIGSDGSLIVAALYGNYYSGQSGYQNYNILYPGVGWGRNTMATSPAYYIDAGYDSTAQGGLTYRAIGVAWGAAAPAPVPRVTAPTLGQWGLIVLTVLLLTVSIYTLKN